MKEHAGSTLRVSLPCRWQGTRGSVLPVADANRERRRDLFQRLRVGDVVEATVAGLASYGALVQIGDAADIHPFADGLIHVSELGPGRVSRPTDAVRVGQRLRARVIGLEPEHGRIRLSLRDVSPA